MSFPFVDVAPAAQNTQGYAAAGLLTIVTLFFLVLSLFLVALPLLLSVVTWAKHHLRRYIIVAAASIIVILLIIVGVVGSIFDGILQYMN